MSTVNDPVVLVTAAIIGWLCGILVNWLADQLPFIGPANIESDQAEADASPDASTPKLNRLTAPRCASCSQRRSALAFSGILGWLTGRRRCQRCGTLLSLRHPLVELFLIVGVLYVIGTRGATIANVILSVYLIIFTLIGVIDFEHRYILNIVMLPAFLLALLEVTFSRRLPDLRTALAGYAVGQIGVMIVYLLGAAYLWLINRRREEKVTEVAFGFGDVTLATYCGLILGIPTVFTMLGLMIFIGGLISILYWMFHSMIRRDYKAYTPVAYGPAILISAMALLLWNR